MKRFVQMLFLAIFAGLAGLAFAAPAKPHEKGILLEERAIYPCEHKCGPLETVYVGFCIQSGDKVLLGRLFDTKFNYDPWKLSPLVGKQIEFRNDNTDLWIVRPDGKELHVTQHYSDGSFQDTRCVAELHRHLLKDYPHPTEPPAGVAPGAVYVPKSSKVGYWTKCILAADQNIVCIARGTKGQEFSHVYKPLPDVHTDSDLIVDPIRTNYDEIVLANGEALIR